MSSSCSSSVTIEETNDMRGTSQSNSQKPSRERTKDLLMDTNVIHIGLVCKAGEGDEEEEGTKFVQNSEASTTNRDRIENKL